LLISPYRPQPAGQGYVSISAGGVPGDRVEWPVFGEQIDDLTAATRPILLKNSKPDFLRVWRNLPCYEIVEYGATVKSIFSARVPVSPESEFFNSIGQERSVKTKSP
jgi:hypothetical protein